MAVAQGATAREHARGRGRLLWCEEVVVGPRVLEGMAVVVRVVVSMDWQHVGGFVAAEAGGGGWRGRLTKGERGARAPQGEGGASG